MSSTDSYTDVLDVGREKLTEGDYLKLAAFLRTLYGEQESETILRVKKSVLDIVLSFDTYKGKHYIIKIDRQEQTVFRGSKPNKTVLYGSVNDEAFEIEENDFCDSWARRTKFHGMKNIERSLLGCEKETFKNIKEFKQYMQEMLDEEAEEEEEPDNVLMWSESYLMEILFGTSDV